MINTANKIQTTIRNLIAALRETLHSAANIRPILQSKSLRQVARGSEISSSKRQLS
jgi:hypothetical protein